MLEVTARRRGGGTLTRSASLPVAATPGLLKGEAGSSPQLASPITLAVASLVSTSQESKQGIRCTHYTGRIFAGSVSSRGSCFGPADNDWALGNCTFCPMLKMALVRCIASLENWMWSWDTNLQASEPSVTEVSIANGLSYTQATSSLPFYLRLNMIFYKRRDHVNLVRDTFNYYTGGTRIYFHL